MKTDGMFFKLNLAVALACTAASTIIAGEAKAEVPISWVRLDNYPNGGTINNTGTNNTITVRVTFCDASTKVMSGSVPRVSGKNDFVWPEIEWYRTASEVTSISVSISGRDWFWIDQIELFGHGVGGYGSRIWHAGADNMQGWCLSNDPTDGNATVCEPDESRSYFSWTVPDAICY